MNAVQMFEQRIRRYTTTRGNRGRAIIAARKEAPEEYNEWMAFRQSGGIIQTMERPTPVTQLRSRDGSQLFRIIGT